MDPNAPAEPMMDPILGQTIGNYRVTQKIGEGGMGSVYLAEHPQIGRKVALKVLHAEFASNQDVVSRFFNEAKAVNDIGHPNIVDVLDYGVLTGAHPSDKLVYFIMEYLQGLTLAQVIRTESPLAPERALAVSLQCADALAASHRCGIVHRDLKPDNIILVQRTREKDFVKLLDFGIAKLTGDQPGSRRTRTGIVMGTPAYMSPEQCEGKGNIDHRTDVYALGIVLYEMLTGRVPFIGEGYGEILVQHLTQAPVSPSTFRVIPPHVEAIVLKALAKSPAKRFPDMEEFMRAMADPVAYVDSRGGVIGFAEREIMPSVAGTPLPSLTPAPLTPPPGSIPAINTVAETAAKKNRLPLLIGGVVALAGVAVAVVLATKSGGGDSSNNGSNNGSNSAAGSNTLAGGSGSSNGSQMTVVPPPDAAPPIDAAPATDASAAVDAAPTEMFVNVDTTLNGKSIPLEVEVIKANDPLRLVEKTPFRLAVDPSGGSFRIVVKSPLYIGEVKVDPATSFAAGAGDKQLVVKVSKKKTGTGHSGSNNQGGGGDNLLKPGDL